MNEYATCSGAGKVGKKKKIFQPSSEMRLKNLGGTPRGQNLLHQSAHRQLRFRQLQDLFYSSGCSGDKSCTIGNSRARPSQKIHKLQQHDDLDSGSLLPFVQLFSDTKCQLLHIKRSIHLKIQIGCCDTNRWPKRCPNTLVVLESRNFDMFS